MSKEQTKPILIDRKNLGLMLSMDGRKAQKFCEQHGVYPINVGLGKVQHLRWKVSEVIQMIGTLQAEGRPRKVRRRYRSGNSIDGKSTAELLAEFAISAA